MNILLVLNPVKSQARELAFLASKHLQSKGVAVFASAKEAQALSVQPFSHQHIDLVVSLGGDGSILKIIHEFPDVDAPIMGINLGSLGFLADISVSDIHEALDACIAGSYNVQDRLMIEGKTPNQESCLAVNEMVVHRGKNHKIVDLALSVDGHYLNTFSADGVIVATPSGSTAYSLSAGGPILTPELDAVVVTPICPHAISNRPIVLKMHHEIEIQYLSDQEPVEVIFDGICRFSLKPKEKFTIKPAQKRFRLITLKSHDFFDTLRTKLAWTGSLKS